jgi:hypothetical protein
MVTNVRLLRDRMDFTGCTLALQSMRVRGGLYIGGPIALLLACMPAAGQRENLSAVRAPQAAPTPGEASDGDREDAGASKPDAAVMALADADQISDGGTASADLAPSARAMDARATASIVVDNLAAGETVPHDLVVISGVIVGSASAIDRLDLSLAGRNSSWPVVGGRFRALVQLALGVNDVALTAGPAHTTLSLRYVPPDNPRFVRFLYLVAADGDGSFEGPTETPHDQASALARLRLGARLMQTFTAEMLRVAGFGRRTFRLQRDAAGEPIVEVWKSKLSNAQARAMDGPALWNAFYRELAELPDRDLSLDVAVMAMTHYVPASQTKLAHTALGGGRLGLFGSGALFTHASTLDEIARAFTDARVVETSRLPDDSAGRGTMWANYATGIGAMEHELGHALSLPHPGSHAGLMWRGFDHFNRTFVISEPAASGGAGLAPVLAGDQAGIDRSNAVRLRYHPWLSPKPVPTGNAEPPQIEADAARLTVTSPAGIRHIQYLVAGEGVAHDEFLATPPPTVSLSLSGLRSRLGGAAEVDVTTIDDDGNIGSLDHIALP